MKITTQAERLAWLIAYLQKNNPDWRYYISPSICASDREFLRGLMNIHPPKPLTQEYIQIQDDFLQEELAGRGVVEAGSIAGWPNQPKLALWRGDITTLAVDAIVNAANSQMLGCFVPCHRCIDNAIHSFAGLQLRQDCNELMQAQAHAEPTGSAKITKAYNLPSRFVLHTVGPIITGSVSERDRELLASCYRSCLELAKEHGLRSLAFCCISTGEYRFPRALAAKLAIDTVLDFLEQPNEFEKIIFNVFTQEDQDIYNAEFKRRSNHP